MTNTTQPQPVPAAARRPRLRLDQIDAKSPVVRAAADRILPTGRKPVTFDSAL